MVVAVCIRTEHAAEALPIAGAIKAEIATAARAQVALTLSSFGLT